MITLARLAYELSAPFNVLRQVNVITYGGKRMRQVGVAVDLLGKLCI
jgi:hypothetical protein